MGRAYCITKYVVYGKKAFFWWGEGGSWKVFMLKRFISLIWWSTDLRVRKKGRRKIGLKQWFLTNGSRPKSGSQEDQDKKVVMKCRGD